MDTERVFPRVEALGTGVPEGEDALGLFLFSAEIPY